MSFKFAKPGKASNYFREILYLQEIFLLKLIYLIACLLRRSIIININIIIILFTTTSVQFSSLKTIKQSTNRHYEMTSDPNNGKRYKRMFCSACPSVVKFMAVFMIRCACLRYLYFIVFQLFGQHNCNVLVAYITHCWCNNIPFI